MLFVTELRKEYVEVFLNLCLQGVVTTCNYFYSKIILFCEKQRVIRSGEIFCDETIRILQKIGGKCCHSM